MNEHKKPLQKPTLSFYTNIPTPYQQSFFNELAKLFHLTVIYYAATEGNRTWNFTQADTYKTIILKDTLVARIAQKKIIDFHFSGAIFKTVWKDPSEYIIVSGAYWQPNGAAALIAGKLRGKKVAYFSEVLFHTTSRLKKTAKLTALQILNVCCDAIFCIGKQAAESFRHYNVKTPKYIIPYNINIYPFVNPDLEKVNALKAKFKSENEVIILSSGALIERKGMDILIRAIQNIENPDIRLIIIGEGTEKQKLIEMCGNDERIIFTGFQSPEEIPAYFAIADIFAFASRYDGWGVVINEAIAANVPIVCSDAVGAAKELITHNSDGLICRSESLIEFKNALETLINDPEKRKQIILNAAALVPLISSDYNANKVLEIFTKELA